MKLTKEISAYYSHTGGVWRHHDQHSLDKFYKNTLEITFVTFGITSANRKYYAAHNQHLSLKSEQA